MPCVSCYNLYCVTGSNNCGAVCKVRWLNTDSNPLIIFAGGLPLDQADEHNTVTVIQGADHVALDFTSAVVDFVAVTGQCIPQLAGTGQ